MYIGVDGKSSSVDSKMIGISSLCFRCFVDVSHLKTYICKLRIIGNNITLLNKSFIAAVGSAQSCLLPWGAVCGLAGQSDDIDVADQIDEVVRNSW